MEIVVSVLGIVGVLLVGVVSPGPSFIFIAQRSVALSRSHALASSLGMGVGGVFFAALALAGLHTLFLYLPWLSWGLKVLGGAYLVYLGWKIWQGSSKPLTITDAELAVSSKWRSFVLGLATQVSNPKTAIVYGSIFASFLPTTFHWEFVALLVPAVFVIEAGWYSLVAVVLSSPFPRQRYLGLKKLIDRVAGGVMAALGIRLIVARDF